MYLAADGGSGPSHLVDADSPSIIVYSLQLGRSVHRREPGGDGSLTPPPLGGVPSNGYAGPLEIEAERAGAPRMLVDFVLAGDALWALSEQDGLSWTPLARSTRARWQRVLPADRDHVRQPDVLASVGVASRGVQEAFVEHIFQPGRFSAAVLQEGE